MPKAVARKVEFTIAKLNLDVDLQLIPLALTPEQCREYRLPRTPIKETERRKDKFESIFGVGATELDALEALLPGELARLLNAELDNWLDTGLAHPPYASAQTWRCASVELGATFTTPMRRELRSVSNASARSPSGSRRSNLSLAIGKEKPPSCGARSPPT